MDSDRLIDEHPSDLSAFGLTMPTEEIDVTLKGGETYEATDPYGNQ